MIMYWPCNGEKNEEFHEIWKIEARRNLLLKHLLLECNTKRRNVVFHDIWQTKARRNLFSFSSVFDLRVEHKARKCCCDVSGNKKIVTIVMNF